MRLRLPLAAGGLLAALHGLAPTPSFTPAAALPHPAAPRAERSCKPSGPLQVELEPAPARADGSVELHWSIRPVLELSDVHWSVEVPEGVLLVEGTRTGDARGERGAPTVGRLRVFVPATLDRAEVALRVTAGFLGSDHRGERFVERTEVRRAVAWGVPAHADGLAPAVVQHDPVAGTSEAVVFLPARAASPGDRTPEERR